MESYLEKDWIIFTPAGTFSRIGDYTGDAHDDHLPFDLHCTESGNFLSPAVTGGRNRKKFIFRDDKNTLQIAVSLTYDPETGIISRRDSVTNLKRKPVILRRYLADFPFTRGEYEINSRQSFWCREQQGAWTPLRAGALELFSREGRYCEGSAPFAVMRDSYNTHSLGFMVLAQGDWLLRFAVTSKNGMITAMNVQAGLSDDRLELELAPNECWEAPEILIQLLPGREEFSGSAAMNRYLNRRFPMRMEEPPVVYNTWLDRMSKLELPRLRKQLAAARECGCEVFVVDYGWYEDHKSFTRLNDWDECTDRAFFGKMSEFADEVRAAGLGFGFWVEFEFFSTESDIVKEHPEWFFASAHPNIVSPKLWLPEVEDHMVKTLFCAIRRYKAVYVKNDMNHSQGYEASRLNRYYNGLEKVMARIKKLLPEVTFENCSSGSLRATAGPMLKNFDTHFISDNASPLENLRMIQHMGCAFPVGRIYHWFVGSELHPGADSSLSSGLIVQPQAATWLRMQVEDLHFGLLSCLTGIIGFSCDLASFAPEHRKIIRHYTDFFKAHRAEIIRSELHLLTAPQDFEKKRGNLALQLSDPVSDTHFMFVFHHTCDGDFRRIFHPAALDPGKNYRVAGVFPEPEKEISAAGQELVKKGILLEFPYNQQSGFKGKLVLIKGIGS